MLLLGHSREARGRCPLSTPAPDGWMAGSTAGRGSGPGGHGTGIRAISGRDNSPDNLPTLAHGRPGLSRLRTALTGFAPRRCRESRCGCSRAAPGVPPARTSDPALDASRAQRLLDGQPPSSGGSRVLPSRSVGRDSSRCRAPADARALQPIRPALLRQWASGPFQRPCRRDVVTMHPARRRPTRDGTCSRRALGRHQPPPFHTTERESVHLRGPSSIDTAQFVLTACAREPSVSLARRVSRRQMRARSPGRSSWPAH